MPNVDAICKSARTGVSQSILALADRRVADALEFAALNDVDLKRGMKAVGLDPAFYLFRGRGRDEVLPWDLVDNGVSKAYYLRELDKSLQEKLSPHCPEVQGCIRCGVCVETPNPSYRLPEKWKALGTSPRYLKVVRRCRMSWPALLVTFGSLFALACGGGSSSSGPSGPSAVINQETELAPGQTARSDRCGSRSRASAATRAARWTWCACGRGTRSRTSTLSQPTGAVETRELHTSNPRSVTYGGFQIELVRLDPAPRSTQAIPPASYRLVVRVTPAS